jgi:hypothetical protein
MPTRYYVGTRLSHRKLAPPICSVSLQWEGTDPSAEGDELSMGVKNRESREEVPLELRGSASASRAKDSRSKESRGRCKVMTTIQDIIATKGSVNRTSRSSDRYKRDSYQYLGT